ncbi:MAG: hypothetical protein P1V97_21800, partial [Planctomycetota bacterium]|nr:hypothetical protein [Planctomycetota bacterium]
MRRLLSLLALTAVILTFNSLPAIADDDEHSRLPAAVTKLLKEHFDGARVENIERRHEATREVFEIVLLDGSLEKTVLVSRTGALIEVHEPFAASALPKIIKAAIQKHATPRSIGETHRMTRQAKLQMIKLDKAAVNYKIVLRRGQ